MKTVCPSCGAIHSAESLFTDAQARQCIKLIADLPGGIGKNVLPYLALFRGNTGRALQWRRAVSLLGELQLLVKDSHIQRGQNVARPNSADIWRQALERIVAQPPTRLPLKSHGYLHSIAYDLADDVDRKTEVKRNQAERFGRTEKKKTSETMTIEMMRAIREANLKGKGLKK